MPDFGKYGRIAPPSQAKGHVLQITNFTTDRYVAQDWRALTDASETRNALVASLGEILTPAVLEFLPPSLQLDPGDGAVSRWIDARDAESRVLVVASKSDEHLIGLVILAPEPDTGHRAVVHVGYLFAEAVWGQGAASEILQGLVAAVQPPAKLVAGVDRENPASARVLQKAGFIRDVAGSTSRSDIYTRDLA